MGNQVEIERFKEKEAQSKDGSSEGLAIYP